MGHSAKVVRLNAAAISAGVEQVRQKLPQTESAAVMVLGDIGLDEYVMGPVKRISPEAPVPVVEVDKEELRAGLAANVAQNLAALGGRAVLFGAVGQDEAAEQLTKLLRTNGVTENHWIRDSKRPTTRKLRVMSGQHHVVRVDYEKRAFLDTSLESATIAEMAQRLPNCQALILQDYGKGVLSEKLCQDAIALAKKLGKKVLVDPHRTTPVKYYRGADLIKPNRDEAFILSGTNIDELRLGPDSMIEVAQALLEKTKAEVLVITQGSEGVLIVEGGRYTNIPTVSRQVYDVTGAGDTFLAAFTLGWCSGFTLVEAALMANAASGVVVGKIGSVPCSRPELEQALATYNLV
jgi:D-glycero-beta-D-manno-heptose-7-phosphate kinase